MLEAQLTLLSTDAEFQLKNTKAMAGARAKEDFDGLVKRLEEETAYNIAIERKRREAYNICGICGRGNCYVMPQTFYRDV